MNLPVSVPIAIVLYSFVWIVLHIGCGYVAHRLPSRWFHPDRAFGAVLASRRWEGGGEVYDRLLRVRGWKDRLPEAGSLFRGGFNKRHLRRASREHLRQFQVATNRAEFSHWLTFASGITFFVWNPWWVGIAMMVYALATNLPFIVVQRFNRPRLAALSARAGQRGDDSREH